ncbi:cyclic nucleotide-binding domain-containing protein [Aurantimonas sp. A3-2-R12]|uniref:cyclic nucleotide-binding domain-containing protein n=1 Tax=Aurantimonas sp. A3-2-R12 TaxID=3114362 RepID=UPI002E1997D6|nr:cyclic nucleotide-binding domain-containing protein [Aurantimonas sp. A3-2-R12]
MSLESDIAILRNVPLFEGLANDQLRLLAFGAERRRLAAGEIVFRQDAQADAGFVIASGTVALARQGGSQQKIVGVYGPGTLLGELALITATTRPANAKAETDCELLRITRSLFRRMLEEYPEYAAGLHERLKVQFADMTRQILALEERFSG